MPQKNGKSLFINIIVFFRIYSLTVIGMFAQSSPFQKVAKVSAAKISESEASQVLVLGTVHLRSYGDDFEHDVLVGLLDVLEKYNPDLIGIESLAPIVVRDMVNSREANSEILRELGKRTAEFGKRARDSLNVSWFEANARVEELLQDIEIKGKDKELDSVRKELVLHFLAAND